MNNLYYTAPKEELFQELKENAIRIWQTYDERYANEKIDRIKDLKNIQDNFMYIVAMFDMSNRIRLAGMVGQEVKDAVRERLKAGGATPTETYTWT